MQSIEFHYSVGPRLGGCAALLWCCAGTPPPPRRTRPRSPDLADRPVADALAHGLPYTRVEQATARLAGLGALRRVCGGCALLHISRDKIKKTTFTRYSCPHPACKLPRTKRGLRVSACSQVTAVQPYRSITFAGAAHSSITSEERPPSPTGVTLCLFSEWKSSASPTCGQGQGQVGGLRGACWARQGSLGS